MSEPRSDAERLLRLPLKLLRHPNGGPVATLIIALLLYRFAHPYLGTVGIWVAGMWWILFGEA
jgi:hypothetical protein